MAGYPKVPIRHIAPPDDSLEQPFQGECRRRTTIEALPEDVLLEIFDFYRLYAMEESQQRPWKWHRLAHVCRKWRHAISTSPRRLDLRILCEHGAPIGSILASWPTLPLVAKFNAEGKSKYIHENVVVALRSPDRLCEIDLQVSGPMLASIVKVTQKPCKALESIRITVVPPTGRPILGRNAFLGGSAPHLKEIRLDGAPFPFPFIRQVLSSTKNLVELHLVNIPNVVYFSPNDFVTGLSTLVHLNRLTVDFPASSPSSSMTHSPPQRATLPSLTLLKFRGASRYLEEFVARIDSPALCKIEISLFNSNFMEIPHFCQFILRLNGLRSLAQAKVRYTKDFVFVRFIPEGESLDENCFLGTWCRGLWELSFVTRILSQLSPLLSGVHSLYIQSGDIFPTRREDVGRARWLEFFRPFTHVTQVYVWEQLVPSIVRALDSDDMTAEVLPELTSLQLRDYLRFPSVAKAAERFAATRRLSGRTVSLNSGEEVRHLFLSPYYYAEQRRWRQQQQQEREQEWREMERRELKQQELKRREREQLYREWEDLERREMERRDREWEELERKELERRDREKQLLQQQLRQQQQQPQLQGTPQPPRHQPQHPTGPLPPGPQHMSGTGSVRGLSQ